MHPGPDWWQVAMLAVLLAASFIAFYLLRTLALSRGGDPDARAARAIDSARRAVARAEPGGNRKRLARARMQLAMLLTEGGGRTSASGDLLEAARLLDRIIADFDRLGLTPEWASAVYYRGRAEWGLGMLEPGTAGLDRAAATFRHLLTLENWPRHLLRPVVVSLPAVILVDIGHRTKDLARMEEGVALAREAVAGARGRIPVEWAIAHRNLAHCLAMLAREAERTALLEEAIGAGRKAVAATRRARYPAVWIASQASLAHALAGLAELAGDVAPAQESVAIYREILETADVELLREGRVSLPQGMGYALFALGHLSGDRDRLTEAIDQLESARTDFRRAGVVFAEAETAQLIGLAYRSLAALGVDDTAFARARACFEAASLGFRATAAAAHAEEAEALAAGDGEGQTRAARFTPGYVVK